jgi:hypothetical protein
MLQKLGLLKYNSNFIFKKENTNRVFPTKSFTNRNWNIQSNTKRSNNFSCSSLKYNLIKNRIQKEDIILKDEINKFIEESTCNTEVKIDPSNLVKIKNNIDDNIIETNSLRSKLSPFKTQRNLRYYKFNDYNIYNLMNKKTRKNKNNSDERNSKINFIHNLSLDINMQAKINEKKLLIKNLEINNESLENKINILKNEYNKNLLNNTDINKDYNKNLINLKYMKSNTNSNSNDLLNTKKDIIDLRNQIFVNNKEQKIINLMLFKERMENELNKEDVNKMNKLIENINKNIENKKNQISEIRNKSKMLLVLINLNIIPDNKSN